MLRKSTVDNTAAVGMWAASEQSMLCDVGIILSVSLDTWSFNTANAREVGVPLRVAAFSPRFRRGRKFVILPVEARAPVAMGTIHLTHVSA